MSNNLKKYFLGFCLIFSIFFFNSQLVLAFDTPLLPINDTYYCSCGRTRFPIYIVENTYFVSINNSQHQAMIPFVVACPCGATPIQGIKSDSIYNHKFTLIDLGHSSIHQYQKYCSTCK